MTNPQGNDKPNSFPYGSAVFAACILILAATWSLMKADWKEEPLIEATAKTAVESVAEPTIERSIAPDVLVSTFGAWSPLTRPNAERSREIRVSAEFPDVLRQEQGSEVGLDVVLTGIRRIGPGFDISKEAVFEIRRSISAYHGHVWLVAQFSMREGDSFRFPVRGGSVRINMQPCEGDCVTLTFQ